LPNRDNFRYEERVFGFGEDSLGCPIHAAPPRGQYAPTQAGQIESSTV